MKPRGGTLFGLVLGLGVGVWIPALIDLAVRLLAGQPPHGFGE